MAVAWIRRRGPCLQLLQSLLELENAVTRYSSQPGLLLDVNMGRTVWVEPPGVKDTVLSVRVDGLDPLFLSSGWRRTYFLPLSVGQHRLALEHLLMPGMPDEAHLLGLCEVELNVSAERRSRLKCIGTAGRWTSITRRNPLVAVTSNA